MAKNVDVLVEDISTDEHGRPTELNGTLRLLSYKSFLYLNANPDDQRFKLIGELKPGSIKNNPDGSIKSYELIPGSPNLEAQHRQASQSQNGVAAAVNAGPSKRELELLAEIERLKSQQQPSDNTPTRVDASATADKGRKKPGPKPKVLTETEITV